MTKISISALVKTSPQMAWTCYTDPKHIVNWNFASDDWCCPSAENNLVVGGKYKSRMEARDGSMGFDFIAIYKAVDPSNGFTYVMEDDREVQVSFTNQEDGTLVEVTFDAEETNPIEMQRGGWQAILNNYKKYTETQP